MEIKHVILGISLALATLVSSDPCDYCFPGDETCWPTHQEELDFAASLKGEILLPTSDSYTNATVMINTRVTRYPYAIVLAENVDDVIKAVNFARKFNVRLTVRSSGHDYIGRSTADGSLQINLYKMQDLKFNLNSTRHAAGEVTAQSGNYWLRVYNETSKLGRVIVGGSAHTVSMGGYTLGGGHSPIGRKFGMAVDNLLEVEMVTAYGSLVYADAQSTRYVDPDTGLVLYTSDETDIFWAVRGGGGGTFGIVTAFTYKLHYDSEMVMLSCYSPMIDSTGTNVGRPFLKKFHELLTTTLAPEWGGYQITAPDDGSSENNGSILLFLNHFGAYGSDSFHTMDPFLEYAGRNCYSMTNVSKFLEYEVNAKDPLYYDSYIFNTFMQPDSFTDEFYDFIEEFTIADHGIDVSTGCTGTLIGGNINTMETDETPVSPNFRNGVMSLTCGVVPHESMEFQLDTWVGFAVNMSEQLRNFGNGTYFNEPSAHLPNWKVDYWGGHYDRLLRIKQEWDPDNVFRCLHCVGSDLPRTHSMSTESPVNIDAPSLVG